MILTDVDYRSAFDRGNALAIDGLELSNCSFNHCGLSMTKDVSKRSTVRNCKLTNSTVSGCDIGPAILENIELDGIDTKELLIIWGALFKNVVFRGECGKIKINHWAHFTDRTAATQEPFDDARHRFYESIDWAIDIRDAKFRAFEYRGIPGRLIKRDPETQFLVRRENVIDTAWRSQVSKSNVHWPFVLELFESDGDEDIVLVAPLAAPKKKRESLLDELRELRAIGVAEAD
jgi:hypothetical protein